MMDIEMKPRTLILRTAGTNCDLELAHAFELAGAVTQTVHLNHLIEKIDLLEQFDLIGVPGGFSYGDDIAAGRIFANRLRQRLLKPLLATVERGVPIIGICNGFQVLIKMGLLPDPAAGCQIATLADNTSGRFIDRWVSLTAPTESVCIWTQGLDQFELPIAHAEGRFVAKSPATLKRWSENGQVAVQYQDNPNGSQANIAGICDPSGLMLGLMPHPERFVHPTHHPQWTSQSRDALRWPAGLAMISNAVKHVQHGALI